MERNGRRPTRTGVPDPGPPTSEGESLPFPGSRPSFGKSGGHPTLPESSPSFSISLSKASDRSMVTRRLQSGIGIPDLPNRHDPFENSFENLLEFLPDALLLLSPSLSILAANRSFLDRFGLSRKAVLGKPLDRIFLSEKFAGWVRERIAQNKAGSALLILPDGKTEPFQGHLHVSLSFASRSRGRSRILLRLWDLGPEISGEGSETPEALNDLKFRLLADSVDAGVLLLDGTGRLLSANAPAERMFGLEERLLAGRAIGGLLPNLPESFGLHSGALPEVSIPRQGTTGRRSDGSLFAVCVTGYRLREARGPCTILVVTDHSGNQAGNPAGSQEGSQTGALPGSPGDFAAPLQEEAAPLPTGHTGRSALAFRLGEILESPAGSLWEKGALLSLDIDRFKGVNDLLGNENGDALLAEVRDRLSTCVRKGDLVVRTGGDEFMILLPGLDDRDKTKDIAEKILDTIARPFEFDRTPVFVNASIGAALWPEDGRTSDTLLRRVDNSLYEAKELGNTCVIYHPEEGPRIDGKFELERELRRALDRGEFVLHFQPQVDIATRTMTGAEALIRWNHPERGLVSPEHFISVAENTGLIVPIGAWVIRSACDHLREWSLAGRPLHLTVNVSVRQLERGNLTDIISRALRDTGVDGSRLEVEITESLLMKRSLTSMDLNELAEMGVRTSIDDFGTGYSSLSYLTRLPVHKLKIDRSFITSLPTDPGVRAVTTAIITMAKALGLRTIAEGVETGAQLAILEALGCQEVQGYLFSPPIPAAALQGWVPP